MMARAFATMVFLVLAVMSYLLGKSCLALGVKIQGRYYCDSDGFSAKALAIVSWLLAAACCVLAGLTITGVVQ